MVYCLNNGMTMPNCLSMKKKKKRKQNKIEVKKTVLNKGRQRYYPKYSQLRNGYTIYLFFELPICILGENLSISRNRTTSDEVDTSLQFPFNRKIVCFFTLLNQRFLKAVIDLKMTREEFWRRGGAD